MNLHADAPPELLSREDEQRVLAGALAQLPEGRGQVVLIAGEPGIGKSSLARWTAARAAASGYLVGWGYCWEAGRAPPYWPWTQCLRSVLEHRDIPKALLRSVTQLIPEAGDASGPAHLQPGHARFQLLEAARSMMGAAAAEGPLVVILEDLHAADYDSLALLHYLSTHLAALPVLLVGTYREGEAQLSSEASPLWRCTRIATVLRPRGLDRAAIGTYLERAGGGTDASLAERILAVTEGNPLFVAEISAALSRGADDSLDGGALPASLHHVIRQHLETLPRDCLERLAEASVLGREFDPASLAVLVDRPESDLLDQLQPAITAGLLRMARPDCCRFTHIFYRDVLYANLESARRMHLHRQRAAALREAIDAGVHGNWSELAEHLDAAGAGYRTEAMDAWRQAARHARERIALAEACALYRHAVESFGAGPGADPEARCALLIEWARVELESGNLDTGRRLCTEVFELAQTLESAGLMARAALTYGSVFVIARVDPVLIRLLRHALEAQPADDDAVRARLQARLAAALQPAPDPAEPIRMAHEAVALARRTADSRTLFETLASALSALMDFAPARERAELNREYARLARTHDDITAEFRAHALMLIDAIELADPGHAELAIDTCGRLARRIGLPHYDWRVESARALRAAIVGNAEVARQHLDLADEHAQRCGDALAEMTLAIQDFCLASDFGVEDRDDFDRALHRIERACTAVGADDLYTRPLIARHWLRTGDCEAARAVLSPGTIDRLIGMREISNICVIGECAALAGDADLARRLVPILEPHHASCSHAGLYGMTWNGPIAFTLGRLYRLVGEQARAKASFDEALQIATRMGAQAMAKRIRKEAGATPQEDTGAAASQEAGSPLALVPEGEFYRLRFRGKEILLQPTRGMEWLAKLVAEPGREWHVLDLAAPPDGTGSAADAGDAGPLLDEQARAEYRRRLAAIDDELEEARERHDDAAVDRLLEEREALRRELGRAFGLGGRERPAGKAAERARVNVTRRLRDAIRRIGEQLPEAGQHFDNSVKTGRYCSYQPD